MSIIQIKFDHYPEGMSLLQVPFDLIDTELQRVPNTPLLLELGATTPINVEPGLYLAKVKFPSGHIATSQTEVALDQTKEIVLNFTSSLQTDSYNISFDIKSFIETQTKIIPLSTRLKAGAEEELWRHRINFKQANMGLYKLTFFAICKDQNTSRPFRFTFQLTTEPATYLLSWEPQIVLRWEPQIVLRWEPIPNQIISNISGRLLIKGLKGQILQYCLCAYDENIQPQYSIIPPFKEVIVQISQDISNNRDGRFLFSMIVSGANPNTESLISYLMNGDFYALSRYDKADILNLAEHSLSAKKRDVLSAVIGGYVLLQSSNLSRLHDWTKNLAQWFPEIPDGAVIYGWHLLKQEKPDIKQAVYWFLEATNRGIPYYTIGLRLLYDGLSLFRDKPLNVPDLEAALTKLQPYIVATDWEGTTTTLLNWHSGSDDIAGPIHIDFFIRPPESGLLGVRELQIPALQEIDLKEADLYGADLYGAGLYLANLQSANLQKANLQKANLQKANLQKANLQKANLQSANLQSANLQKANLQKANLQKANLQEIDLQGANLQGVKLIRAKLIGVNLQGANLQSANLQFANLQATLLYRANLQEAKLQFANLQSANLQRANLKSAKLEEANLQSANLQGANLQRANLQRANLQSANLQRTNLQRTKLQGANLQGANLQGADLKGANLYRAYLKEADLSKAIAYDFQKRILINSGADISDIIFISTGSSFIYEYENY